MSRECMLSIRKLFLFLTKDILLCISELEYGSTYEIEYMEKIGSSIAVSFYLWNSCCFLLQYFSMVHIEESHNASN